MSHPPETSLQLVLRIRVLKSLTEHVLTEQEAAALIDAWVRVREAQAKRDQHQSEHVCENTTKGAWEGYNCKILATLEAALAAARKQLEEKVK